MILSAPGPLDLRGRAAGDDPLFLPRIEPHPAGMWVGLGSAAAGALALRLPPESAALWGWVALAGLVAGMVLHWRLKKAAAGWRIEFAARRAVPVQLAGEAAAIEGGGWSIQIAPGERRQLVAIDLRHRDRGRVARLYEWPARRLREQRALSELADLIAERLRIERAGPRIA